VVNLQGVAGRLWGCMLATYKSYGSCWGAFGAVCWQPTGLMGVAGLALGLYVASHEAYQGLLDRLWLYVGNLQVFWALLDRLWLYVGNLQVL